MATATVDPQWAVIERRHLARRAGTLFWRNLDARARRLPVSEAPPHVCMITGKPATSVSTPARRTLHAGLCRLKSDPETRVWQRELSRRGAASKARFGLAEAKGEE
jgi:hypothetical protein